MATPRHATWRPSCAHHHSLLCTDCAVPPDSVPKHVPATRPGRRPACRRDAWWHLLHTLLCALPRACSLARSIYKLALTRESRRCREIYLQRRHCRGGRETNRDKQRVKGRKREGIAGRRPANANARQTGAGSTVRQTRWRWRNTTTSSCSAYLRSLITVCCSSFRILHALITSTSSLYYST